MLSIRKHKTDKLGIRANRSLLISGLEVRVLPGSPSLFNELAALGNTAISFVADAQETPQTYSLFFRCI
jgi:hypothetical protein